MIKILIADDHAIVREGLKQIVTNMHDLVVADEAGTGHEVLDKVIKNDYDVIVLDIMMPGVNGLDVLKQIKGLKPELPILILSMYPEEQFAIRFMRAGAAGYMTKESASEELIEAIRMVSSGKKYITKTLAERLAFELETGQDKPSHERLSDREYQVMRMIASGKKVKQIAAELFLSEYTVRTYRSRILEKMRMKTDAELTQYAIKNNLMD
jgi:two-component system invasion response regulator UvrY